MAGDHLAMVVPAAAPAVPPGASANALSFTVEGTAVPKARPRVRRRGDRTIAYTPAKTRRYEQLVARAAADAMAGRSLLAGALGCRIRVHQAIPKRFTKAQRERAVAGRLLPAVRPDMDNLIKSIVDGMAGVVMADDGQIVELIGAKLYADDPCVHVTVWELGR